MKKQKFKIGDWVKITKDETECMDGRNMVCEAIILSSFAEDFGRGSTKEYSAFIKEEGGTAWYHESQISLIDKNRIDILKKWEQEIYSS